MCTDKTISKQAIAASPNIPTKIYSDGGVLGKNPSSVGGTWAWVAVDKHSNVVAEASGWIEATPKMQITNNFTEMAACILALEAMPDGWSGTLCSDSQITLGRLFWSWKWNNIPTSVVIRARAALDRLGNVQPQLVQGHPNKKDLLAGFGSKTKLPVSIHNKRADELCNLEKKCYEQREQDVHEPLGR